MKAYATVIGLFFSRTLSAILWGSVACPLLALTFCLGGVVAVPPLKPCRDADFFHNFLFRLNDF